MCRNARCRFPSPNTQTDPGATPANERCSVTTTAQPTTRHGGPWRLCLTLTCGQPAPTTVTRRRPDRRNNAHANVAHHMQQGATINAPRGNPEATISTVLLRIYAAQCNAARQEGEARVTGLEPATSGSTVRCSNQLSYTPRKSGPRRAGRTRPEPDRGEKSTSAGGRVK